VGPGLLYREITYLEIADLTTYIINFIVHEFDFREVNKKNFR